MSEVHELVDQLRAARVDEFFERAARVIEWQAKEIERTIERCAKVAETQNPNYPATRRDIADAIRALKAAP